MANFIPPDTRAVGSGNPPVDMNDVADVLGLILGASPGTAVTSGAVAAANALSSASGIVTVSAATAPAAGQVLTATSGTAASWQAGAVTSVDGLTGAVNLTSSFDAAGTAAALLGSLTAGAVVVPVTTPGIAPSSGTGIDGDYAWDPVSSLIYGPKASGTWPAAVPLTLLSYAGAPLTSGEATVLRETTFDSTNALTSGTVALSYFTAVKSEPCVDVTIFSSTTASTSLTYAAVGLYSVDGAGALTLQASTPSSTSMCNTAYTAYKTSFSVPYSRTAGSRYAIGVLMTGSTMPSLLSTGGNGLGNAIPPRAAAAYVVSGGSPLPASITDASLATTYIKHFVTVTPS